MHCRSSSGKSDASGERDSSEEKKPTPSILLSCSLSVSHSAIQPLSQSVSQLVGQSVVQTIGEFQEATFSTNNSFPTAMEFLLVRLPPSVAGHTYTAFMLHHIHFQMFADDYILYYMQ